MRVSAAHVYAAARIITHLHQNPVHAAMAGRQQTPSLPRFEAAEDGVEADQIVEARHGSCSFTPSAATGCQRRPWNTSGGNIQGAPAWFSVFDGFWCRQ